MNIIINGTANGVALNDENAVKLKNAPIRVNVTVTEHFFSLKDNFVFEEKGGENTLTYPNLRT